MSSLTTSIHYCTRSPRQFNKTKKEIKSIHSEKEEIKQSLFTDDMIFSVEKFFKSPVTIADYSKFAGYKLICKSQLFSSMPGMKNWNLKLKTQYRL